MKWLAPALLVLLAPLAASAQDVDTYTQYLGNEGVMVSHGDTRILFDPLFDNGFNTYQMVPNRIRSAIFAGEPPYDGVDAVFVSHFHGDHFSAADILKLLDGNDGVVLYAPAQAVAELRRLAGDEPAVFDRVVGLDLEYGDPPMSIRAGTLVIDAAYLPHSGWPTARTDVQNLAYRVTIDGTSTVLHLGDADARAVHFVADEAFWEQRVVNLALPPYWFFQADDGREILESRMNIRHSIGIHVPVKFADPANLPPDLQGRDLFTDPGEGRRF